jgi:segregation and condensation protein B
VDHETQQLDGNKPQPEATPDGPPDANSGTSHATGQEPSPEVSAVADSAAPAPPEPVSSMSSDERKAALEAIIYAADEPATIEQLAKALSEPKAEVQVALDELIASYAADNRGIEIRGVAGGYKMYTKPQHHDLVRRFIKSLRPPLRLTMPALETLAVISYKQPVTAPEIQEIRGVNTSGVIKTLLDKKLITTAGRKEVIGRPILYRTSKEFLMRFGLSDLGELPSLKEFEALAREALGTDEGVAESEAGDESVLDSVEPTEAEAVAELEASASEGAGSKAEPAASEEDSAASRGVEQTTPSADGVATPEKPAEAAATPEHSPQSTGAIMETHEATEAHESHETQRPEIHADAEPQQSPEAAAEFFKSTAEPTDAPTDTVGEIVEPQPAHESSESGHEATHAIAASSEAHNAEPAAQSSEPEPVAAPSGFVEPASHESAPAHAAGISMGTPESPVSANGYEASTDTEPAEEISDEILAQLAQGIEIEVSADSLAALSSNEAPAEKAPAQFYSSDAEPERQPLPAAQASENATEQSSEHSESDGEFLSEPEKSRRAAAGE